MRGKSGERLFLTVSGNIGRDLCKTGRSTAATQQNRGDTGFFGICAKCLVLKLEHVLFCQEIAGIHVVSNGSAAGADKTAVDGTVVICAAVLGRIIISIVIVALALIGFLLIGNIAYNITGGENKIINEVKEKNEVQNIEASNKKVAVVYFSATGTTKQVAELIKDETSADIFEIMPKQKYTSEDLNYGDRNTRATKEQNDENARPEIENKIDLSNYDIVYLGYPIWWGNVPKIVLSFMDNTNLDGKTVIPFCTSGSTGISTSENTLKSYKTNIKWISGKRFFGRAAFRYL